MNLIIYILINLSYYLILFISFLFHLIPILFLFLFLFHFIHILIFIKIEEYFYNLSYEQRKNIYYFNKNIYNILNILLDENYCKYNKIKHSDLESYIKFSSIKGIDNIIKIIDNSKLEIPDNCLNLIDNYNPENDILIVSR